MLHHHLHRVRRHLRISASVSTTTATTRACTIPTDVNNNVTAATVAATVVPASSDHQWTDLLLLPLHACFQRLFRRVDVVPVPGLDPSKLPV